MDDVVVARALHVVGVVLWIGGVAFVTTVLLPAVRETRDPAERAAFFEKVEKRFAVQARFTTLLVGATGLHLLVRWDLWHRFADPAFWWMHGMVAIWAIFTFVLFAAEPLFLRRWFAVRAKERPERIFALIERFHWVLLTAGLLVVLGAVAGSHGG
ncbi:MAG: hypothetical protein FJW24_05615 [Acidimicrobiia bacterium]|nr:hypothetical protein [Acidimicrobiia bacterium]